jgi:D-proline reductase (dithiol) PrdB
VGLVQRAIENEGIATISITLSEEITKQVRPPRALFPGFPLGHPIAFPGQTLLQLKVLRLLLNFLEELDAPGSIVRCDLTYSDDLAAGCARHV